MKETLYKKIFKDYSYRIKLGELSQGDRITEKEIMACYGVSRITAAKALNLLKESGLVRRTKRAGTEILEETAQGQRKKVAVVLSFLQGYSEAIRRGMDEAAEEKGISLHFFLTGKSAEKEREILLRLQDYNLGGLIIDPCTRHGNIDAIGRYMVKKTPVIFVDSEVEGLCVPCVSSDNRAGMFLAADYLIKKGHSRIAYYPMHLYFKTSESERFKGYCNALINSGISVDTEYLLWASSAPKRPEDLLSVNVSDFGAECAEKALRRLMSLKDRPTAVCCVNDYLAESVFAAAGALGIHIPGELSVTGFDGGHISENLGLTTVVQNFSEMGRVAFIKLEALFKNISDNRDINIPVKLAERGSVREIRG